MRWVRAAISTFAIAALATPQSWAQSRTPMQELEGPTFQSEAVTAVSTNPALAAERARVRAVRQCGRQPLQHDHRSREHHPSSAMFSRPTATSKVGVSARQPPLAAGSV